MSWDTRILLCVATYRSEGLDAFFRGVTWLGSLYVLLPLSALIGAKLLYRQKREEALLLAVGFGGATVLVHLTKALLLRPRPAVVESLVALPADSSFPSAHATQITAFALCLLVIIRRIMPDWQLTATPLALLIVAAVAFSRLYLQVHFPSDVLAGIVLGIGWVALLQKFL
jgi:membrane-associated phospholipid phosphatase